MVNTASLWIAVFTILVVHNVFGVTEEPNASLGETLESPTTQNSHCYASTLRTSLQPSCRHKPNTIIAIDSINVASKTNSSGCPVEGEGHGWNGCCRPDHTTDCIFNYRYKGNSSDNIEWNLYQNCSGYDECMTSFPVTRDITAGECNGSVYHPTTNYMFFSYACVERSRQYLLTRHDTFSWSQSKLLYLRTDQYPNAFLSGYVHSACNVTSESGSSNVSFYTLDIRLTSDMMNNCEQSLVIEDISGSTEWDCNYMDGFNISKYTFTLPATITFTSNTTEENGRVWLAVEGDQLIFDCNSTLPALDDSDDQEPEPDDITTLIIIAAVAVVVGIVIIVIIACCMKQYCKNKIKPM